MPAARDAEMRELKVRLEPRHHLRLHSMKILLGKPIQDTVAEALDAYFAARPELAALEERVSAPTR